MDKRDTAKVIANYLATPLKQYENFNSLYLYMEGWQTPKAVISTTKHDYDYSETLYKVVDLRQQAADAQTKVNSLKAQIRQLEKSKLAVEKAIKLIAKTKESEE